VEEGGNASPPVAPGGGQSATGSGTANPEAAASVADTVAHAPPQKPQLKALSLRERFMGGGGAASSGNTM
jgi:hypothetical protein